MRYNKLTAILLLCLLGISLAGMAAAEPVEGNVELNLANGDVNISVTRDQDVIASVNGEIKGTYPTDTVFHIVSLNENDEAVETTNRILVKGNTSYDGVIEIELENVFANRIGKLYKENGTPFELDRLANVNLTLIGENKLVAANGNAGLKVPESTAITINGPGSLTAFGGKGMSRYGGGAGIGGEGGKAEYNDNERNIPAEIGMKSGRIVIQNEAIIIAVGGVHGSGDFSNYGGNAAAIGGGGGGPGVASSSEIQKPLYGDGATGGDATYIEINNATVTAYAEGVAIGGGNGGESAKLTGAEDHEGISGDGGSADKIIIKDASVTAVSWNATAIGGGNGGYSGLENYGDGGNADVVIENSTLLAAGSYDAYQTWSADGTEPDIYGAAIGSGGSYGEASVSPSISIKGEKTDIIAIGFSLTAGKGSGGENTIEMNNGSLLFIGKDIPLARDEATELSPAGFITETETFDKINGAAVTTDSGYSAFTRSVVLTDVFEKIVEEKYSGSNSVNYIFEPGFDELTGFGAAVMWVPLGTAAEFTFAAEDYPTTVVESVTSDIGDDPNVNFIQYVTMTEADETRSSSGSGYGSASVLDVPEQESMTGYEEELPPATPASGFTNELEPEQESGFDLKLGFGILALFIIIGCASILYLRKKNR